MLFDKSKLDLQCTVQRTELHSGKKMFWNRKMLSGKAWNSSGNNGHKSRIDSMTAQRFLVAACWEEESHVICGGGFFLSREMLIVI